MVLLVISVSFSAVLIPTKTDAQPCVNTETSNALAPAQHMMVSTHHLNSSTEQTQHRQPIAHLKIINNVNNTGCSTECLSAYNSTISVSGNNPNPRMFNGSAARTTVSLGPGDYNVTESKVSAFYGEIDSSDCSGTIKTGETKTCIITNSYANNIQTWMDKTNNVKIQFSYLPPYPFVGNKTELGFKVKSNSKTDKPLEVTHIHIALIKNVTANFNNSNTISNKNDFITINNITATHGNFSLDYQFLQEGAHQIIVKVNTKDGKVALASFDIPVLLPE
jgi:hypothetical protein